MSNITTNFSIIRYSVQPELAQQATSLDSENYPPFIEADSVWAEISPSFYKEFADFQFFIIDSDSNRLAALSRNVPFNWDGDLQRVPTKNSVHVDFIDFRGIGALALLA